MNIEITTETANNIMIFLDRVEVKGLKEIHAMNEILNLIYKAKQENEDV